MKRWMRWLVMFAGYPVVLYLTWLWLGLSERNPGDLVLSLLLAVGIVGGLTTLVWIVFGGSFWRALGFVVGVMTITILMSMLPSRTVATEKMAALRGIYPYLLRLLTVGLMAILMPLVLLGSSVLLRKWKYWAAWIALAVGVYVIPSLLIRWVPELQSLTAQTVSMVVRFGLAYVIALATFSAFARYVRELAEGRSSASREA